MIPFLRRVHKMLWPIIGIVVIVLFVMAYLSIPKEVLYDGTTYNSSEVQLPNLNESIANTEYKITYNLRSDDKHKRQIEVIIEKPLTQPSNILIVRGYNYGDEFINQSLGAKGVYRYNWIDSFELAYEVSLLNNIKNVELDNFNLKLGEALHDHNH